MLRSTSSRLQRFFPLALLVCLPLALAACDSADDPGTETFSETVTDIRVEFSFDRPSDLTGPLQTSSSADILNRLCAAVPGGDCNDITGVRISRVKVDLLQPSTADDNISNLNRVEFYLANSDSDSDVSNDPRQLVAAGEGFEVGGMRFETRLDVRNAEVGSLVRSGVGNGLRAEAIINADPSTPHRVEIEFDAVVSFN